MPQVCTVRGGNHWLRVQGDDDAQDTAAATMRKSLKAFLKARLQRITGTTTEAGKQVDDEDDDDDDRRHRDDVNDKQGEDSKPEGAKAEAPIIAAMPVAGDAPSSSESMHSIHADHADDKEGGANSSEKAKDSPGDKAEEVQEPKPKVSKVDDSKATESKADEPKSKDSEVEDAKAEDGKAQAVAEEDGQDKPGDTKPAVEGAKDAAAPSSLKATGSKAEG